MPEVLIQPEPERRTALEEEVERFIKEVDWPPKPLPGFTPPPPPDPEPEPEPPPIEEEEQPLPSLSDEEEPDLFAAPPPIEQEDDAVDREDESEGEAPGPDDTDPVSSFFLKETDWAFLGLNPPPFDVGLTFTSSESGQTGIGLAIRVPLR